MRVYPGDRLKIPVIAINLTSEVIDVKLSLIGESASAVSTLELTSEQAIAIAYIQPEWFEDALEKRVIVPPGSSKVVDFYCCPPASKGNIPDSQPYWFNLQAIVGEQVLEFSGKNHVVEVLPYGSVEVVCKKPLQKNPLQDIVGVSWRGQSGSAEFTFDITNNSNLAQQVEITIEANGEPNSAQEPSIQTKALTRSDDVAISEARFKNDGGEPTDKVTENSTTQDSRQHLAESAGIDVEDSVFGDNTPVNPSDVENSTAAQPTVQMATDSSEQQSKVKLVARETIRQLLPGGYATISLSVRYARRWFRGRRYHYNATTTLSVAPAGVASAPVQAVPQQQALMLDVPPILPRWLQIAGALASLVGVAAAWWLTPNSHHLAPVNSVQLIGNATTVVSGSSDQTLRRWDVVEAPWQALRTRLLHRELIAETDKSIQVIQASPFRDSQLAVGLESGDIELWDVSPPQQLHKIFEGSDRVFDLAFTPDAHYLFSGHGSGLVREWNLQNAESSLKRQLATGIAISTIAVLQIDGQSVVAIGGQYNTLLLWNLESGQAYQLEHSPSGTTTEVQSQANYITGLATTKDSRLLAVADNRGYVSLWRQETLSKCLNQRPNAPSSSQPNPFRPIPCPQEQAQAPPSSTLIHPDGQGIRAIALPDNGCYLATADNGGRLRLWPLISGESGEKILADSIQIAHYPDIPLRALDIEQVNDREWLLVTNGPRNQISLHRYRGRCRGAGERGSGGAR
ncbi:hypothetical protein IQ254_18335, partial [Nodosilinea sp. LEGE 07088]|uniref:WD40 repeat domain-containing protein n=1 Tax=Nodosilinea sp. LEGE 07088 TaxID=2777968 RepID=UPI001A0D4884